MRKSGIVLLALLAIGGIVMVAWASGVETSYVESLLLNAGTACVLFAALYLAQRFVLDRQVENVRQSVDATHDEIDELRKSVTVSLEELGDELDRRREIENRTDDSLLEQFRVEPNAARLRAMLDRARQLKAVSANGPRAEVPGTGYYLRAAIDPDGDLHLGLEDESGNRRASLAWTEERTAADMLVHFRSWLDQNTHFANANMQPALEAITNTIEIGIGAKTGRRTGPTDLSPIIEQIGPTWAITDFGIEAIGEHHYVIESSRLNETDWYSHVGGKSWVDQDEFWHALMTAERLFGVSPSSRS